MKKILKGLLWLIPFVILSSCEKELHKYEGKPTIYFNETARTPQYSGEVIKDSTVISFSLAAENDSIVNMVIMTMGEKVDADRPYLLKVGANSDMVEGTHYEMLNSEFVIRKNQLADTIHMKFFRTPEMEERNFLLSFDLLENENFSTSMQNKVLDATTGKTHSFVTYRWYVNDIIKRPSRWFDAYLGVFSRKKLFLMAEVMNIEPAYLDTSVAIAEMFAYGKFMQRYLNEQRAAGNTIYEEDETTIMVMGPSAQ